MPTLHSALNSKSDLAIAKGACAIIIFNGFNSKQFGESDKIRTQNFGFSLKADENKVPFIQVKQSLINEIETVSGKDFAKIQKEIDENKKPNSFVIPNLKMSLNIQFDKTYAATSNIVAIINKWNKIIKLFLCFLINYFICIFKHM